MSDTGLWIEKLRFTLQSSAINSEGPRSNIVCPLTEDLKSRCHCEWVRYENFMEDSVKLMHASNPEHVLIVGQDGFVYEPCSQGHAIGLCSWAARVIEYVHPKLATA